MEVATNKIVFLDAYTNNPGDITFEPLSILGDFVAYDRTSMEELPDRVKHADIVIVNKFKVDEVSLALMENVKYIVVAATGYNNIDVSAVKKRGIPVSNVSGYSIHSVAQHVFASIFALLNRHEYYDAEVKAGRWAKAPDFCFYDQPIFELYGKTMGIVGYGDIGRRVGDLALTFGMKVIVHTRDTSKSKPDPIAFVDLDTLCADSDFVSLHCPLTEETNQLVRKENLRKMKPTAILINTGRGALVHEMDLFYALDHGTIQAAALDVLTQEPPALHNPLLNHPNCLVTPHIAWAGQDARKKLIQGIAENITSYLNGNPRNIVG